MADGEADKTLVERFLCGDGSAFDQIVARHKDQVAGLAYRLLGWSADADDVVQDVFLSVFKNLARFRGQCSFSTWLTTITVNMCRQHRRKRLLQLRPVKKALVAATGKSSDSAERNCMAAETFEQVRQAVRGLRSRDREVVVLRYLEEMSVADVADVLDISKNAVHVRLNRARKRLKRVLGKLVEE